MGLFERMGLVERDEDVTAVVYDVMPEPEVDAEINSVANIVEEIYSQNNLSDRSNSIYTVQALIDTLPEEMTTTKKQSTVSGILLVSGKSVESLVADAEDRANILCSAKEKIVGEYTSEIETAKADIEELKAAIERANVKIKEAEEIIAATEKSVNDEVKVIDALVEFCNGMGDKQ